ncbi:hypothetical protein RYX36_014419 [Vicia faba]
MCNPIDALFFNFGWVLVKIHLHKLEVRTPLMEGFGFVQVHKKHLTLQFSLHRKYEWLPEHEEEIKKIFDHKDSDTYSNTMYRVRKKIDPGDWIHVETLKILEEKWNDDKWKRKLEINTHSRRSSDDPLHTGGSIPSTDFN